MNGQYIGEYRISGLDFAGARSLDGHLSHQIQVKGHGVIGSHDS